MTESCTRRSAPIPTVAAPERWRSSSLVRNRRSLSSPKPRLCLKLMIDYGLKPDASQARVGPYRVDFLYERERLIVEVDGYRFHRTKQRFVRDRRRRAERV